MDDATMAQLQKLANLHNSGVLSDDEFTAAKKKLLVYRPEFTFFFGLLTSFQNNPSHWQLITIRWFEKITVRFPGKFIGISNWIFPQVSLVSCASGY